MRATRLAHVVAGVALAAGLVGCGRAPDAHAPNAPDRARTLYGVTARVGGLDPVRGGDVASARAYARLYEGLLQYAYLKRPYELEPLLAQALPEISEDGCVYTFRIRRGIYFHDDPCFRATGGRGRELAAADFVYALKRVADRKNASPGYWAFRGRIVGLDAFRERSGGEAPTDYDEEVPGLQAPDRATLRITLTEPCPQFLWVLALHYAYAVPHEAVERYGEDFVNHPVGTGPYRLKSWRRNYRMEFVRHPAWHAGGRQDPIPEGLFAPPGETLPFPDRLVDYVVSDPSTQWQMFLRDELALVSIPRDSWNAVVGPDGQLQAGLAQRGVELVRSPTLDIYYIAFNMDDPVVGGEKNRALRQAMTCAFHSAEWIRCYHGRVTRPDGPVPPRAAGYTPHANPFPYDLDRARRLLAEAGYPDGIDPATGRRLQLTLDIADADNPEIRQSTDLFVQFMDRLGLVVQPSYNNRPAFFDKVSRRQAQMFRLSWVADYPDAENFLQLFYGPNASPGSNRCNYSNPAYDRLYEELRTKLPGAERDALVRRMEDLVIEDAPWIFTHHPLYFGIRQPWLQNFTYHDFGYGMEKYLHIQKPKKGLIVQGSGDESRLNPEP